MPANIIDGPAIALVLHVAAMLTAALRVRVPVIRRTTSAVAATRLTAIDGLRGFLGLGVFIHHTVVTWFYIHGEPWQLPPSRFIAHLGDVSVTLFFMITAFLFWGRAGTRGPAMDWLEFFIARLYRLYPAYLLMVALLVCAVLFAGGHWQSIGDVFFQRSFRDWLLFTMFHTQDLNGYHNTSMLVANVTWSLRYEWLFYIALPLIAFLFSRARSLPALAGSAAVLLFLYWRFGWTMPFDNGALHTFFGGIAAVYWVRSPTLVKWSRSTLASFAALAAVAAVMAFSPYSYWVPATVALTLFFAIVASGNNLWGVLRWRPLLWLGDVTYSIYLLHGLLLWLVFQQLLPHDLGTREAVFVPAAAAVAIMLVAACSATFILIERPGILLGRRHYRIINGMLAWRQGSRAAHPVLTSPPATTPDPVP